jgi:cystathionine beta-synthase
MPLVVASVHDSKADVIKRMKDKGISQLPVVDDSGCYAGIVTEVELLEHLFLPNHQQGETIEDVISHAGAMPVSPDLRLSELMDIFAQQKVGIVVDNHHPIGIVTKIDLIDYLAGRLP